MGALLDLLFPPRCPGCRELLSGESGPFCRPCRETFTELPADRCPRCSEPDVKGLCGHCRAQPPPFERAVTPYLYGAALADAVHRFKYEDSPHYAKALAATGQAFAAEDLAWAELVAPIPLHVKRLRTRGYDQALLLARALAGAAGRPVEPRAAVRVRETATQVGRDRLERRRNVQGAFEGQRGLVQGKRVLLVDDVLTTGSTAAECAQALLDAGASAVRVFALARAF